MANKGLLSDVDSEVIGDVYKEERDKLLENDSLTAEEEGFMQGWDKALDDKE